MRSKATETHLNVLSQEQNNGNYFAIFHEKQRADTLLRKCTTKCVQQVIL